MLWLKNTENCCEHICASYYCKICCNPDEKPECSGAGCRCLS